MNVPCQTEDNNEQLLCEKQVMFLDEFLKTRMKKAFEDILGNKKTGFNSGHIAEEWEFIHYEDAGNNWRTDGDLFCECGRKLRYQYTLANKTTGLQKHFGLNHLTEHTGIQPDVARQIVKELKQLKSEKREIIQKCIDDWTLTSEGIKWMPPLDQLPEDISWHLTEQMPLLERQLKRLRQIIQEESRRLNEKALQKIVAEEKKKLAEKGLL